MNIKCTHCGQDITKDVTVAFTTYDAGKVICPHCKKENKRVIGMYDLSLYLFIDLCIYSVGLVIIAFITKLTYTGNFNSYLNIGVSVVGAFAILYALNQAGTYIYEHPFKSEEWKNRDLKDVTGITKKDLKRTFFAYLIVLLLVGVVCMMMNIYWPTILLVVYLLLVAQRTKEAFTKERDFVKEHPIVVHGKQKK